MIKGRIKVGSLISHDFAVARWPNCKAPAGSKNPWVADDPNMIFEMEWCDDIKSWKCTAPGFGELRGWYGNGSIYVHKGPRDGEI